MRFARFALPVVAMLLVAGCTRADGKNDAWEWLNSRESNMEKHVGLIPTGYADHNKNRPVLKPVYQEPSWKEQQEAEALLLAETDFIDPADAYPQDVVEETALIVAGDHGPLVEQIYFRHGSAKLSASEQQSLRALAQGINKNATAGVGVTVVGHASTRVDGVQDPVRRKMVNFEMAQKRANAVTNELNRAGLNPAWIQTVSKGDDEPAAVLTGGRTQEEADRRADIFVRGAQYD